MTEHGSARVLVRHRSESNVEASARNEFRSRYGVVELASPVLEPNGDAMYGRNMEDPRGDSPARHRARVSVNRDGERQRELADSARRHGCTPPRDREDRSLSASVHDSEDDGACRDRMA